MPHTIAGRGGSVLRRTPARKVVKKSKYYESPISDASSGFEEEDDLEDEGSDVSFVEKSGGRRGRSSDDDGEGSFRMEDEDEDDDEGEDPLEYCSEDEESADEEFSGDDGEGDYDE
jgi:hypothetical protein